MNIFEKFKENFWDKPGNQEFRKEVKLLNISKEKENYILDLFYSCNQFSFLKGENGVLKEQLNKLKVS